MGLVVMFYSFIVIRVWQKVDILYSQSLFSAVDRGCCYCVVEERSHRDVGGDRERKKGGMQLKARTGTPRRKKRQRQHPKNTPNRTMTMTIVGGKGIREIKRGMSDGKKVIEQKMKPQRADPNQSAQRRTSPAYNPSINAR